LTHPHNELPRVAGYEVRETVLIITNKCYYQVKLSETVPATKKSRAAEQDT